MLHYTKEQIDAANHMDIAAFLLSRGEKLIQRWIEKWIYMTR